MAMGYLRNEQLVNTTRNQKQQRKNSGGIGISFVTTMLERFAHEHQVIMSAHLSPLDVEFQQRLAQAQRVFRGAFSPSDALAHAQASIYQTMQQQASYWAFMQLFFILACLSCVCALVVFFFKNVRAGKPVVAH